MVNHQQIIEEIYALYKANGFVREDKVLDVMGAYNLSLQDLDILIEKLLGMGVIISDDTDDVEDNDQIWKVDNTVFSEVLSISAGLSPLIDHIKAMGPPKHQEWRTLLPQARNGNLYANNRLFGMYLFDAIKIALRFVKDKNIDLDDAVQECSIGLIKAVQSFRSDKQSSFRAFAQLCISRQIITSIKTATRQKHSPLNSSVSLNELIDNEDFNHTLDDVSIGMWVVDPEELIVIKEEYDTTKSTIMEILSLKEQKILFAFLDGKTYREIAYDLRCHVKSVDNAVQRIRRKLGHHFPEWILRNVKQGKKIETEPLTLHNNNTKMSLV